MILAKLSKIWPKIELWPKMNVILPYMSETLQNFGEMSSHLGKNFSPKKGLAKNSALACFRAFL